MKLDGLVVLRSQTTIYVLAIVASLGAMIAMHRGKRVHVDRTDCSQGDQLEMHYASDDRSMDESLSDELRPLERHDVGAATNSHRNH